MKLKVQTKAPVDGTEYFAPESEKKPRCRSVSFEKNHPKLGLSLNNLGNSLFRNGDYKSAMENYLDALAIFTDIYQEEHIDIANTLGNVGNTYWRIGNMTQAAKYLEYSLHVHRLVSNAKNDNIDSDDTIEVANTLHSIGIVYYLQGNSDKALGVFSKALKSRENVFGYNSIDVARTLDAIGSTNIQNGSNLDAIQYFEESLIIKRALLVMNHSSIVLTMKHLANAYRSKLDYCKALNLYEEVLHAQSIDDFSCFTLKDIGETLQVIGEIYMQRMQHSYAIPYFTNAISNYEKAGVEHDDDIMVKVTMCMNAAIKVAELMSRNASSSKKTRCFT